MIPLISGLLYRLDGWGKGDSFLPIWPLNQIKCGGINYARMFIGFPIFMATHNGWYPLTYFCASLIPYGENSWLEHRFGPYKWFIIGALFGGASLSLANALIIGMLALSAKVLDIDHAWFEFGLGCAGTLIFLWR